ncbi:hypothetical protein JL721_5466 [Aureococcus anophagefferens]|nr:hypothetical protein JL721_5466 [Aureococcus anophagefferens]
MRLAARLRLSAARLGSRSRALSAAPVRFQTIADEPLLEVACLRREAAVIEGAPVVVERDTTRALLDALEALAARPAAELAAPTLDGDTDWELDGFTTYSSKSFRLARAVRRGAAAPAAARRLPAHGPPRRGQERRAGHRRLVGARERLARARARGWDVANAGDYVVPSPHHAGMFEEPRGSRALLEAFDAAHGGQLAAVAVKDETVADRWGAATLRELLDAALAKDRLDESSTALSDLRFELGRATEFPVLLAVDEYTSFLGRTDYFYDHARLAPADLVAVSALAPLGAAGVPEAHRLARGCAVLADSWSRGPPGMGDGDKRKAAPHAPFELKLAAYSRDEFRAALDRDKAAGYFEADLDAHDVAELEMATQRNPQHLDRAAMMRPGPSEHARSLLGRRQPARGACSGLRFAAR